MKAVLTSGVPPLTAKCLVALRPNVTQEGALREFRKPGLAAMFWRIKVGTLQRIADAYVPYKFYEVSYTMTRVRHTRLFAMDAVDGSLDLFEFPRLPGGSQVVALNSRNCLQDALPEEAADELLREKALRLIFQQGFFKVRESSLQFARVPSIIYVPYWLAFYSNGRVVRCRVLDAVRRRIEGSKASAFFEQWLAA